MHVPRKVNLPKNHSYFLFGARGTGKSTLLRELYPKETKDVLWIDLLRPEEAEIFTENPSELTARIAAHPDIQTIVIDEVQKCPKVLDLVHLHIEESKRAQKPLCFILTGSSARKLRRGQANLLAGRAWLRSLFPLTFVELGAQFDLMSVLSWGSLPQVFGYDVPEEKQEYLETYAHIFVAEEIVAEQVIRKLPPFKKFLRVAAQSNGKIINASKIAGDIGTDYKTVQSYFQIMEDTYLGYFLYPAMTSFRKSLRKQPKFYFFDTGITRALARTLGTPMLAGTYEFGNAFEHLVVLECLRLNDYLRKDYAIGYITTQDQAEIDLVVERHGEKTALIEIKSATHVDEARVRKLQKITADFANSETFFLSQDPQEKKIGHVHCLEWRQGLLRVFNAL